MNYYYQSEQDLTLSEQLSLMDAAAATKMGICYVGGKNVKVLQSKGYIEEHTFSGGQKGWRTTELGTQKARLIRDDWDGKNKKKKEKIERYEDDYYDDYDDYWDDDY